MCLKRAEKKKLLVRHNKVAKWFNYFQKNTEAARLFIKPGIQERGTECGECGE